MTRRSRSICGAKGESLRACLRSMKAASRGGAFRVDAAADWAQTPGMFPRGKFSIPAVLLTTLVVSVLVTGAVVGWLVASGVTGVVRAQAQERVGEDLRALSQLLERRMRNVTTALAGLAGNEAPEIFDEPRLAALRKALRLDLLRVCDPQGRLLGTEQARVPIDADPVLRQALRGRESYGFVRLSEERLRAEGGEPLARSLARRAR